MPDPRDDAERFSDAKVEWDRDEAEALRASGFYDRVRAQQAAVPPISPEARDRLERAERLLVDVLLNPDGLRRGELADVEEALSEVRAVNGTTMSTRCASCGEEAFVDPCPRCYAEAVAD